MTTSDLPDTTLLLRLRQVSSGTEWTVPMNLSPGINVAGERALAIPLETLP